MLFHARANRSGSALFQIPEVWLIDLQGGHLDVHRAPDGGRYSARFRVTDRSHVEVASVPDLVLDCRDLF
ncbi:hypothetical protein CKO40_12190 [Halochromatium glycolicum]|uniref:Restriction endonuclease domain-containing protein n=1 Tax=Halochromatium glycolicum TaxID=85075 RepID=A0AAJ0U5S3_9GAMM|nr:hypothetical protein [Halochromatium glycolicum]